MIKTIKLMIMNIHADKTQSNKNHVVSNDVAQKKHSILNSTANESAFQFTDNRPETTAQMQLQKMVLTSPQANQALQLQSIANSQTESTIQKQEPEEEELLQGKFMTLQKQPLEEEELLQGKFILAQKKELEEEELLQGKFNTIQKQEIEEEELLQGKFEPVQKQENDTGLPDNLKSGIENLSGLTMNDVQVHYNSDKPAGLQAHAYAQGTDIHLAPGQEKHLPHEAWHVVQQKQGRVKPTMQLQEKVNVNDDKGLEKEADVMGAKAISATIQQMISEEDVLQGKFEISRSTNNPVQMISEEDGKQAVITFALAAGGHGYTPEMLEPIIRHRFAEIHTGNAVPLALGKGTEEGIHAGRLVYNCWTVPDPYGPIYHIHVFHAHGAQTERLNPKGY
jgi:hypothetical protein